MITSDTGKALIQVIITNESKHSERWVIANESKNKERWVIANESKNKERCVITNLSKSKESSVGLSTFYFDLMGQLMKLVHCNKDRYTLIVYDKISVLGCPWNITEN